MSEHTPKPYAVTDEVWELVRPAAREAGREERRAIRVLTLGLAIVVLAAAFVSWSGLLSPDVGLMGGRGSYSDMHTRRIEAELRMVNSGIVSITIDGPATINLPGVVVDRVSSGGPVPGRSLVKWMQWLLNPDLINNGPTREIEVELAVTSCSALGDYIEKLRDHGRRSVALPVTLTVPVQTWRGTTNVTMGNDFMEGAESLGRNAAQVCEIDLDRLPAPTPAPLPADRVAGEFVAISPGTFMMGHAASEDSAKHQVTITKAFEIGKYEVTQAQWWTVMETDPSDFVGDNLPVEMVSWKDAQLFLMKLNALNDGYHYRLPTDAEWEYAARAGSTEEPNLDAVAWRHGNSNFRTHPVGTKEANAWGIHDMLGNVQEWVEDWWQPLPATPQTDPQGPPNGMGKFFRGGSFNNTRSLSFRMEWIGPDGSARGTGTGFRCVRERIR